MAVVITRPTDIRDWLEQGIKVRDFYTSLGLDELEAMRSAMFDMNQTFDRMRLRLLYGEVSEDPKDAYARGLADGVLEGKEAGYWEGFSKGSAKNKADDAKLVVP